MTLFVIGVALSVLLIASYSQRRVWVARCSTAMSIAALMGWLFISITGDASHARAGLMWLASQLPLALDQQALDDLTTAIVRGATAPVCDVPKRPGCATAASHTLSPLPHDVGVPQSVGSSSEGSQPAQAGAKIGWLDAKADVEEALGHPVIWVPDESRASSGAAAQFLMTGMNVSGETLSGVRATLKPDSTQRELELALNVHGSTLEDEEAIPAGARFSLGLEIPTTDNHVERFGGAIFAFRYVYAGRQRATIWYLTSTMIAQSGAR